MRECVRKLGRGVLRVGMWVAVLFSGHAVATGAAVTQMAEARGILDECIVAEASLQTTRAAATGVNDAYRTALYAAETNVAQAYRLSLVAPWPADLVPTRTSLNTILVTTVVRLHDLERPGANTSATTLRSALTKEITRVHRAVVLLEGIAPPAVPVVTAPTSPPSAPPTQFVIPTGATTFAWTDLQPSVDSKVFYCSSATGNDANDGLDPTRAFKTIKRGMAELRDGYPDWLLLKRGDTWTGETFGMSRGWQVSKSGRSATEPMVIWSYGTSDARPKLIDCVFQTNKAELVSNLAMLGLHFERVDRSSSVNEFGIFMLSYGDNLLFEDMYVSGYAMNMFIDGGGGENNGHFNRNLKIRGCVIVDSRSGGYSSGVLMGPASGAVIEGCVLDHNGWVENSFSYWNATMFNHNMYVEYAGYPIIIRNNIIARGSSHGSKMAGGLVEDNLFLQNAIAVSMEHYGTVRRNVFIDGRDISATEPRGYGIWYKAGMEGGDIYENVLAHQDSGVDGNPILMSAGMKDVTVRDNVVYDWRSHLINWLSFSAALFIQGNASGVNVIKDNIFQQPVGTLVRTENAVGAGVLNFSGNRYFSGEAESGWFRMPSLVSKTAWPAFSGETGGIYTAPNFTDPNRSPGSYNASLGGVGTLDEFLNEARKMSRRQWRPAYLAMAANAYIRAGFGK